MKTLSQSWTRLALAGLVAASLAGCAADLVTTPGDENENKTPSDTQTVYGTVRTQQIDATASEAWIYFNLTSHALVTPATPEDSTEWDLAFQRHRIKSNSGDSGKGGVSVTWLDAQDFDALKSAPSASQSTYVVDSNEPTGNAIKDLHFAFLGDDSWYQTDTSKMPPIISPKENRVYVVKTTGGKYVKLQMLSYYSDAGTSGNPKFKYAEIEAPQH